MSGTYSAQRMQEIPDSRFAASGMTMIYLNYLFVSFVWFAVTATHPSQLSRFSRKYRLWPLG